MNYGKLTKAQLIETIECLQCNVNALRVTLERQYDNFKRMIEEMEEQEESK